MYCDPLKVVCMVIPIGRVSAALSLMAVTVILPVCASAVAVTPDGVCSSILSRHLQWLTPEVLARHVGSGHRPRMPFRCLCLR